MSDALKRRQLDELFRVTDPGAGTIREYLKERQIKGVGDALRDSLPETIRPPRVTAWNTGNGVSSPIAAELAEKCSEQFGGTIN